MTAPLWGKPISRSIASKPKVKVGFTVYGIDRTTEPPSTRSFIHIMILTNGSLGEFFSKAEFAIKAECRKRRLELEDFWIVEIT
jgi:hypothetical protein